MKSFRCYKWATLLYSVTPTVSRRPSLPVKVGSGSGRSFVESQRHDGMVVVVVEKEEKYCRALLNQ
jgi:hypothetical protein